MNYLRADYIVEQRPFFSGDLSPQQRTVLTMLITNGALPACALKHKCLECGIGDGDRIARGLCTVNLIMDGRRIRIDRRPYKGKQKEFHVREGA